MLATLPVETRPDLLGAMPSPEVVRQQIAELNRQRELLKSLLALAVRARKSAGGLAPTAPLAGVSGRG